MKHRQKPNSKFQNTFLNNQDFKDEFRKSRKRFAATVVTYKNESKSWNDSVLKEELNRLMVIFKIPRSLESDIEECLKTGKIKIAKSPTMPQVLLESAEPNNEQKLTVYVYKHTTKQEYMAAWENVEKLQKMMIEMNPKPLSKRDLLIIKLYKEGKTDREIADELDKAGYDIYESNVRRIVSELRKQLSVSTKTKNMDST